eukprot:jgi/Chlat1/5057/Chrsp33S05054
MEGRRAPGALGPTSAWSSAVEQLPVELVGEVLAHLDGASLARATCVSRRWRDCAARDELWQGVCARRWPVFRQVKRSKASSYKQLYAQLGNFSDEQAALDGEELFASQPDVSLADLSLVLDVTWQGSPILQSIVPGQLLKELCTSILSMRPQTTAGHLLGFRAEHAVGGCSANCLRCARVLVHAIRHSDGGVARLLDSARDLAEMKFAPPTLVLQRQLKLPDGNVNMHAELKLPELRRSLSGEEKDDEEEEREDTVADVASGADGDAHTGGCAKHCLRSLMLCSHLVYEGASHVSIRVGIVLLEQFLRHADVTWF